MFTVLFVLFIFDTGCRNASIYGSKCNTPCPTNCEDNRCHILTGACSLCKPGWTGIYCNKSKMTNMILRQSNNAGVVIRYYSKYHNKSFH